MFHEQAQLLPWQAQDKKEKRRIQLSRKIRECWTNKSEKQKVRQGLQNQEKKLIQEIQKSAKQGKMGAVKVMEKDLVRTRHQIEKFYTLKSQLQGVSLRVQTLESTQANGRGKERCDEGDGPSEQTDEPPITTENYARV